MPIATSGPLDLVIGWLAFSFALVLPVGGALFHIYRSLTVAALIIDGVLLPVLAVVGFAV